MIKKLLPGFPDILLLALVSFYFSVQSNWNIKYDMAGRMDRPIQERKDRVVFIRQPNASNFSIRFSLKTFSHPLTKENSWAGDTAHDYFFNYLS